MLPIACRAEPPGDAPAVSRLTPKPRRMALLPRQSRTGRNGTGRGVTAFPTEKGLLPSWPEAGPRLVWKIGNLGHGWSSPIIVRDRLYITGDVDDDLVIFAFDLDGKPLWQAKNGRSWTGSYPGARACCAYSEGKLYHMNAHGRVVCLEAATGKELWAVDVLERFQGQNITWAMSECLLVDGSRVIVTPGGEKALMAALDKESGRTIWTTEAAPRGPGLALLAAAVPPCRDGGSWLAALRRMVSRWMPTRQTALDRAAEKSLRRQRRHAGLRCWQDLLHDSLRLRDVLPIAAGREGAAAGEGMEHDLGHLYGHSAAGGRPALRQRLQEAQVLAVPGLEVGRDALRVEGPDDRGGRVCGWAAVLPGRGRAGGTAAADARAVRDRRPVPARAEEVA